MKEKKLVSFEEALASLNLMKLSVEDRLALIRTAITEAAENELQKMSHMVWEELKYTRDYNNRKASFNFKVGDRAWFESNRKKYAGRKIYIRIEKVGKNIIGVEEPLTIKGKGELPDLTFGAPRSPIRWRVAASALTKA
jgi:hypothetical protein